MLTVHRPTISLATVLKWGITAAPLVLGLWLLNQNFLLTAKLSFRYTPGHRSKIVVPARPVDIIRTADEQLPWRISSDTLPFTARLPRPVRTMRVQVRLTLGNQPTVFFLPVSKPERGQRLLVESLVLDVIPWSHLTADGMTLWQREKRVEQQTVAGSTTKKGTVVQRELPVRQYVSLTELRTSPPDPDRAAVVGINPYAFVQVPNYRPASQPTVFGHTLRGSHDFYVYAANEDFGLRFNKVDLNRKTGRSSLTVTIARVDQLRDSQERWTELAAVGDDGVTNGLGKRGASQPVEIRQPNLAPGLYLVRITTSEDVLLQDIVSDQAFIAAKRLFLAEGPAYGRHSAFSPITLVGNGQSLTFSANHDTGLQDVVINGKTYHLRKARTDQTVSNLTGLTTMTLPKGDAIVSTDGWLTFSNAGLIPNQPMKSIDVTSQPVLDAYDYVLADYVSPKTDGPITIDQTYQVSDLQLSGPSGKLLTFRIDAPGLAANNYDLGLHSITVTLVRGPFPWDKVWKRFNDIFVR